MIRSLADSIFIPNDQGDLVSVATSVAETVTSVPPSDLGMSLVKMLLTFLALILLLFVSYWFLRRLIQHRLQRGVGRQSIEILEKRMISPKTMLYIVRVENKEILLAESHLEIKVVCDTNPSKFSETKNGS